MNNSTAYISWEEREYWKRADWFVPITVNVLLTISMFWVMISLVHFGIKNRKWTRLPQNNYEKLSSGWIYSSVTLCSVLCIFRYLFSLVVMNDLGLNEKNSSLCKTLSILNSCSYSLIHFSTWLFLWLRQYTFYTNRMLMLKYSKSVRSFSFISILLIVMCGLGFTVFTAFIYGYRAKLVGCLHGVKADLVPGYWTFVGSSIILVHSVLFGLFVHALLKSRNIGKKEKSLTKQVSTVLSDEERSSSEVIGSSVCSNSSNAMTKTSNGKFSSRKSFKTKSDRTRKTVRMVLRKTFWFAFLSVLFENTLPIVWCLIKVNERIVITSYNISAFLNVLLIIFSFVYYKSMLLSFCF